MNKKFSAATIAVAVGLSLVIATPVSAAPVVDQTQAVTLVGISGPSCVDMGGVYNMGVGSTFTAGVSGLLTSIDVPIAGTDTPSGLTMNVWNADAVSGLPMGAPIASQAVSVATLDSLASGGNLSVGFGTPATIVAANKYAFTLDFPADCAGSSYSLWMDVGEAPSDKRRVANVSGNFSVHPQYGLGFTTYVESPPTKTPPSELSSTGIDRASLGQLIGGSAMVVALGAVFLSAMRRRT
jgi:hypothetical protein